MLLIDFGLIAGVGVFTYQIADKYISNAVIGLFGTHKKNTISDYELILGYQGKLIKKPIIVDMRSTPHLLCCGLSGQGKSRCIEYAVKGKDVVLLNAFHDDFKTIKGRRVVGDENILKYLESLVKEPYKREKPLYIVIDELLVLCIDKKISNAIKDLLAVGRHYNLICIGIAQRGTKQDLSFKDLFNSRMTFRQVEGSAYASILGYSIEDKRLNKREFILASDDLYKGMTYDV